MKFVYLIGISFLFYYGVSAQDLTGSWINELGSVLVIDSIATDGSIQGVYKSSSGVDGKTFELTGAVNQGNTDVIAIAFRVRWEGYSSITSWTGFAHIDSEGPYIKTMWHLVRPDEKEPWERIITNSSTFRPYHED